MYLLKPLMTALMNNIKIIIISREKTNKKRMIKQIHTLSTQQILNLILIIILILIIWLIMDNLCMRKVA